MALSLLRRRAPEANQGDRKSSTEGTSDLKYHPQRSSSTFSMSIVFLLVVAIWSTATLLSGSVFHICVSSRKLNVYCISGSTGHELAFESTFNRSSSSSSHNNISTLGGLGQYHYHSKTQSSNRGSSNNDNVVNKYDEKANGIKAVEEQMKLIRALASPSIATTSSPSCDGRGIYIYDLPQKFNYELLGHCQGLLPWEDLCSYFTNEAMGDPLPKLGDGWHRTYQYSLEPIFHNRVLTHPCRTHDPDEAAVFYVPFYGGLDVLKWNFNNVSNVVKDSLGIELITWLEQQPPWARRRGRDHVFVLGRVSWDFRRRKDGSWGNKFLDLDHMKNPYKLLVERQPWETNDVGVPYPTHFHPHSDDDIDNWQSKIISSPRKNLVGFVEKAAAAAAAVATTLTTELKSELVKNCNSTSAGESCKFVDCNPDACSSPEVVVELFTESEFCLHPPADDSPSRRSVFESMVAGCIPVLFDPFTAYHQYPWHLPEDRRLYSVYIDQEDVTRKGVDVVERLRGVTKKERDDIRRYIVYRLMPGLVYGDSTSEFRRFRDAFGIAVDNVLDVVVRRSKEVE